MRAITWQLGGWEAFWILFYGFATYGNAGWMREQVCKYMCPYARFQCAMFDKDTLVIAYDAKRGEPRGARSRKVDRERGASATASTASICVQVCPTGIDIRKGLQYECIGCAACIDGCDQVMDKMGYPRGLIRYASQNAMAAGEGHGARMAARAAPADAHLRGDARRDRRRRGGRPGAAHSAQGRRDPRSRRARAREPRPASSRTSYRLHVMNTDERARSFRIEASGLAGLEVVGVEQPVALDAAGSRLFPFRVRARADAARAGLPPDRDHRERRGRPQGGAPREIDVHPSPLRCRHE